MCRQGAGQDYFSEYLDREHPACAEDKLSQLESHASPSLPAVRTDRGQHGSASRLIQDPHAKVLYPIVLIK